MAELIAMSRQRWLDRLLKRAGAPHRPSIATRAQWAELAARHGYQTAARTETVKCVIDLHDGNRAYFFDSNRWETHYGFVQRFIDPRVDYDVFLAREYTHPQRRFLLGAIMHYLDGDHWTLELASGDSMSAEQIAWMYEQLAPRLGCIDDLRFRPLSPGQIAAAAVTAGRIPVLSRDAINASVVYQPVVLGVAYGYLRLLAGSLDVSAVRPSDVVVTADVPEEIPPVAALITSQLQAPLAHVAVLSRNRNTPDMALRGATEMPALRQLSGELVKLTVGGQDYSIERAALPDAEKAWEASRPKVVLCPECDVRTQGLLEVGAMPPQAIRFAGAKAAQVSQLSGIPGIVTPGGFVVPFSAYVAHLESAQLTGEIAAMLADASFCGSANARAERLGALRAAVESHPVDPQVLEAVHAKIAAMGGTNRYILRSSTNAEDMEGFNGAGLYESKVIAARPTREQIADVLRSVWASVWLQRAFEEREWFRIDHRSVAMAVLVQPFVEEAAATGVAITGNPFKAGLEAVFINVQTRGATVTGALGNELPEQFLVRPWGGTFEVEVISRSTLTSGAEILSETEVHALTHQLLRVHEALLPQYAATSNAMDVEFAVGQDRHVSFLQARPYNIVYGVDREAPQESEGRVSKFVRLARRVVYRFIPNSLAYRAVP